MTIPHSPALSRPLRTREQAEVDIAGRRRAAAREALTRLERGEPCEIDIPYLSRRSTLDALAEQQNAERG